MVVHISAEGEESAPLAIEPLLVRVPEAARLLGLGRTTVYELLDRGELPSVRCGAARRIPLDALRAWVERRTERRRVDRRRRRAYNPNKRSIR